MNEIWERGGKEREIYRGEVKTRRRENGKERGSGFVGRGIEKRGREILRGIKRRGVTRERGGARLTEKKCGYEREKSGTVAIKGNEKEDVGGRR